MVFMDQMPFLSPKPACQALKETSYDSAARMNPNKKPKHYLEVKAMHNSMFMGTNPPPPSTFYATFVANLTELITVTKTERRL